MSEKYRVVTLGCRTNQYESQAFQDQLEEMGYARAKEGEAADLCIVNTCTVTESADSHSRRAIRQLVRENPNAKVAVTGCFAEQNPEVAQSLLEDGVVIRNKDKEALLEQLFPEVQVPEFRIKEFHSHTRAFVKVQDGCNSFCTYCIIPYVRGRSTSRPIASVVEEVEGLVAGGMKEIVLTGINIGDYEDGLVNLVKAVDDIDGLERIRISSIDPDEVDDPLLEAVVGGKKTCHSMHLVLQSGSNAILKRMNRKYTRQIFMETVDRLRAASPDFSFTTDVIVGFPGETEKDLQETLDLIEEVQFAKVHMFPYSDRARTRASMYPNKVPPELMKERKARVIQVAERSSFAYSQGFLGRSMKVLLEDQRGNGQIAGHTDNFLKVWVDASEHVPGEIVTVELVENSPEGLIGKERASVV